VSICTCRHKASHLGTACEQPQKVCLSLNFAAESLVRNGMAESITDAEEMRVLEDCREKGLVQIGDNVQRRLTYICNCCGCCCEMIGAIKRFDLTGAVVTSNWIMEVDAEKCTGCGKCAKVCPLGAIQLVPTGDGNADAAEAAVDEKPRKKPTKRAVCDEALCFGCGVCESSCKFTAAGMRARSKRVFTPETVFDRTAMMAIERGKLAPLIFGNSQRLSHRALGRLVAILEKTHIVNAAMAIAPLRSIFLRQVIAKAKEQLGAVGEILT